MSIYCAEVLSPSPDRDVKILLISQQPDGFFLERFNDRRELVGSTRHDEMDDAMREAYSEYGAVSDWSSALMTWIHWSTSRGDPTPDRQ